MCTRMRTDQDSCGLHSTDLLRAEERYLWSVPAVRPAYEICDQEHGCRHAVAAQQRPRDIVIRAVSIVKGNRDGSARRLAPPGPEVEPVLQGNGHVTPFRDCSELSVKLFGKHVVAKVPHPPRDLIHYVVHENRKRQHRQPPIMFKVRARGSKRPTRLVAEMRFATPVQRGSAGIYHRFDRAGPWKSNVTPDRINTAWLLS